MKSQCQFCKRRDEQKIAYSIPIEDVYMYQICQYCSGKGYITRFDYNIRKEECMQVLKHTKSENEGIMSILHVIERISEKIAKIFEDFKKECEKK